MNYSINDSNSVTYDQILRTYNIIFTNKHNAKNAMSLYHCPWCGTKLPERLNSVIFRVLEKEYGIEDPDIWNFTNVPDEFRSDAWWKKLGEQKINEYLAKVELERKNTTRESTDNLRLAPTLPTHGEETLRESIEYNRVDRNCYGRIGVDPSTGETVYFEWSREPSNSFSGYVVNWQDLPSDPEKYRGSRQALINYGIVGGKTGRIEPKLRWSYK